MPEKPRKPEPSTFEAVQVVRVRSGSFEGHTGLIERVDEQQRKVTVGMNVFGHSAVLELGFDEVELNLL